MDPFTPIQVDPDPDDQSEPRDGKPPGPAAIPTGKPDAADAGLGLAQNLYILGVIENQTDAAVSGAAEVTGVAGDPIVTPADAFDGPDPLDGPDAPDVDPVQPGGDGCLGASFALLLTLTLAAGTALALAR